MGDRSHSTPLVIGVGIFADALKGLEHLVEALGDVANLAIVVVPQVDSKTYSKLTALLQRHKSLRILDVTAQTSLHAGWSYLCPVGALVELRGEVIVVIQRENTVREKSSVDHLFCSLAQEYGERSVGILLSPSGEDGTFGLREISAAGGLTLAPIFELDGSATTYVADYLLPIEKITSVIRKHAVMWKKMDQLQHELVDTRKQLETATQCNPFQNAPTRSPRNPSFSLESNRTFFLESTNIAAVLLDNDLRIRSFTGGLSSLYRLGLGDIGRPLQTAEHFAVEMPPMPDDLSLVHHWPLEDEVETFDGRWFLRRIEPYVDQKNCQNGSVVTFYEITEQHRLRMRLAAAHAVTKLLADADSFDTVIPKVLNALRISLSAEVCLLWRVDNRGEFLNCVETDTIDSSFHPFVDLSLQTRLASGEGLPGQVWKDREPVWFEELQNKDSFVRAPIAKQCDLTSGVGTPIIVGKTFKGVIEIYTTRKLTREPELLQLLGAVGNEIGQFIRQRRLMDTIRDEEARKSAILQSALDCVITMDTDGRIVDFNPAAERTFGYVAADVVGKILSDVVIPVEFREAHRQGLARYLSTRKSELLGHRVELTAQRADGSLFPVELAISVSHGRDGFPFFTGYLRDITERKQADAILVQRAELAALQASLAVSLAGEAPLNEIRHRCCERLVEGLDAAFARVWLVISQRLAEMLGGTITASSTEGVGSIFRVCIATGIIAESDLIDYRNLEAVQTPETATGGEPTDLSCARRRRSARRSIFEQANFDPIGRDSCRMRRRTCRRKVHHRLPGQRLLPRPDFT
jgi:PAS domain S-box-containing protein